MSQTRSEARELVLSVLRDGQRSDRILRVADDGHYYTSPDLTFIGNDGPYTPPYVKIPVSYDGTEQEEDAWAEAILEELDTAIGV